MPWLACMFAPEPALRSQNLRRSAARSSVFQFHSSRLGWSIAHSRRSNADGVLAVLQVAGPPGRGSYYDSNQRYSHCAAGFRWLGPLAIGAGLPEIPRQTDYHLSGNRAAGRCGTGSMAHRHDIYLEEINSPPSRLLPMARGGALRWGVSDAN